MNHRTKNRRTGESNTEELVACLGKSGEKGSGAQRANRLGAPCSQATMVNGLGRRKNQLRRRETRPDLTGSETKAWAWSPTRKSKTSSGTKINRKLRRPPNLGPDALHMETRNSAPGKCERLNSIGSWAHSVGTQRR
jgi:hypothetical protein